MTGEEARFELAGLLSARADQDAREALDLPPVPARRERESLPDYLHRAHREDHADSLARFERARTRYLRGPL